MDTMDNKEQDNGEIGKEPDKTNPEDLLEYIWLFTHLFNKKKFEKILERCEWDHEINLIDKAPKELNAKAYTMTLKEEEVLNQWLDEQLKAGLIMESKSRYVVSCFYIPKKDGSLRLVQDYRKLNQVTNWTWSGDTTIYRLKKEMNGRLHSWPTKDYSDLK